MRRNAARAAAVAAAMGAALLVAPTTAPASTSPRYLHSFHGDQTGELYGWAVSELADINGDGAREGIVGAPSHARPDGSLVGHVDVRSGRTGRLLFRFLGNAGDRLGYAIADAGDVNRDGVHDIVAGAPASGSGCAPRGTAPGRAYVYSGATGSRLLTLRGHRPGDHFGAAVASAGDLNGDGRTDLLVGAPCSGARGADSGRGYVHSGRDGSVLLRLDADQAGDQFGTATAPIRDVNRDGIGDLLLGAKDAGSHHHGRAYLISGRDGKRLRTFRGDDTTRDVGWFFVAGVPSVDGDNRDDVYVGDFDAGSHMSLRGRAFVYSSATGRAVHVFNGRQAGDGLGPGRSAGDVDRDGVGDLAIGSYTNSTGATQAGRIQVFSGATGRQLLSVISSRKGEDLGFDVVGLGDVNHDGRIDLLASAAGGDRVYIIST